MRRQIQSRAKVPIVEPSCERQIGVSCSLVHANRIELQQPESIADPEFRLRCCRQLSRRYLTTCRNSVTLLLPLSREHPRHDVASADRIIAPFFTTLTLAWKRKLCFVVSRSGGGWPGAQTGSSTREPVGSPESDGKHSEANQIVVIRFSIE